jgi:hypothetical protein
LTQSINELLKFRTKIFPGEYTEVFAAVLVMNLLMSLFLHVLKDSKPQARRALLASASDKLITVSVECAINTLNGNQKLNKHEKTKLSKYKNRLRALVNPEISFKSKRKILIQKGVFIVPLLTSILSSVIGPLITNNN